MSQDKSIFKPDAALTNEQQAIRQGWRYRTILATKGNQSMMGALVIAVCGKRPSNGPRIMDSGKIDIEGNVTCTFQTRDGTIHENFRWCSVEELTDEFSRLADRLKLPDHERVEMFGEVRRWISKDERAETTLHFTQGRYS